MSQANIELAKQAFEAFSRRDLETLLSMTDPEVEFFAATGEITDTEGANWERGAYWGEEGVRTYFEDVGRIWEELEVEPEDFRALGEQVLVTGHIRGKAKDGSLDESAAQWVIRFRGGKMVYWAVHTDVSEALEAVGLPTKPAKNS
jgi:ketosteroid isomerase-like protein